MKIKTFEIEDRTILPKNLGEIFNTTEYCVIDIETTGLSRKYHQVILIGILYNTNDTIILKQFFAENPNEEINILLEFSNTFRNFPYVITYNGATFDIPFLKERFIFNNLEWNFDNIKHIDILQCLRKEKKQLPLENFKLKTVERFVGINRKDTISGKDSVLLYKEYVKNPSPSVEKTILLHNYEDIYYLNKLLTIFDSISIQKYDLIGKEIVINHHSKKINFNVYPKNILIKKGFLHIKGITESFKDILDVIYFGSNFNFEWYTYNGEFNIEIPLCEGYLSTGEKCSYINLENFNLSKSLFSKSDYYNEKYFPNKLMILKLEEHLNIHLIGELLSIILKSIFSK